MLDICWNASPPQNKEFRNIYFAGIVELGNTKTFQILQCLRLLASVQVKSSNDMKLYDTKLRAWTLLFFPVWDLCPKP